MKEKNSIYMNNYNRELFNQYTPYLQLLKAQQKDLSDRLGKKQFSGTHVYMLPFSSCMDDIFAAASTKAGQLNTGYCNYIPDVIHEKITPLVFEGENSRATLLRVYREMEKRLPYQLKQYVSEFKKENNTKYVSTAYVIANTPELLNLFDEAVKSFL